MRISIPDLSRISLFRSRNNARKHINDILRVCHNAVRSNPAAGAGSNIAAFLITTVMLCLIFTGCRTWDMLTKKYSTLYSEKENLILAETTAAINFKYGYDPDLEIDYVYKAGQFTEKDINSRQPEMKKILNKYPKEEVVLFYEKIVELKETQTWKMNRFMDRKKWTDYTYIQKYLLPETEQYLNLLEKNILQIDSQYKETISERKEEIKMQTEENLQKKQEAHEKKIREERRPAWR